MLIQLQKPSIVKKIEKVQDKRKIFEFPFLNDLLTEIK